MMTLRHCWHMILRITRTRHGVEVTEAQFTSRLISTRHPLCLEWLAVENVLRNVKRDFFILPARIYLADYSEGNAAPIVNMNGEDVRSSRHNLEVAPWEVEKHASAEPVRELLRTQLPYTQDEELPARVQCFYYQSGERHRIGALVCCSGRNRRYAVIVPETDVGRICKRL